MATIPILPNLLSLSRVVLALPCAWSMVAGYWIVAGTLFATAVVTDIADGRIARSTGTTSVLGGLFDHASDAAFVTLQFTALAWLGISPWALVLVVPASFLQYVFDSDALAGAPLRASIIGRSNGIAYFVLAGFPLYEHALELYLLPKNAFMWCGWLLVTSTLISMLDRLWAFLRLRIDAPQVHQNGEP